MAQEPTNPPVARLLAVVMLRLGLRSASELARALEMPPYSQGSISLARKWIRGDHAPSFDYTMTMLSKAGLLAPEADAAWRGITLTAAEEAAAAARAAREAASALPADEQARHRRERGTG